MKRVVIAGAGLAGLTAGVRLADAGFEVSVLERSGRPGGRVRRVTPRGSRAPIDWGQHLMLGCYHESLALAKRLGTESFLRRVEGLTPFLSGDGQIHPYRLGRLPAPLHVLPALAGLTQISMRERLALGLPIAAAKLQRRMRPDRLDRMSAAYWLEKNGQSKAAIEGFWEPLVLATLNTPIKEASALLLATVIDRGFFANRRDAVPLLPRTTLHDLFAGPAVDAIRSKGGRVCYGQKVEKLIENGNGDLSALLASREEKWEADFFVLALPCWDAGPLLRDKASLRLLSRAAEELGSSPIVTVELWFDRPWMRHPYAGLLGSPVQWVFNHNAKTRGGNGAAGCRVSLVISPADSFIHVKKGLLVDRCLSEILRYFPEAEDARLIDSMALRAPKATFRARPGQNALRPGCRTPFRNLFLAGDWTATGLPATMEGAVVSGNRAAGAISRKVVY